MNFGGQLTPYSIKQSDCALFKHTRSEWNSRTLSTEEFSSVRSNFSLTNISRNAGGALLARVNA